MLSSDLLIGGYRIEISGAAGTLADMFLKYGEYCDLEYFLRKGLEYREIPPLSILVAAENSFLQVLCEIVGCLLEADCFDICRVFEEPWRGETRISYQRYQKATPKTRRPHTSGTRLKQYSKQPAEAGISLSCIAGLASTETGALSS